MTEPAFPQQTDLKLSYTGMTLRDYFAAKALPLMLQANVGKWGKNYEIYANRAYEFADAMMKARQSND